MEGAREEVGNKMRSEAQDSGGREEEGLVRSGGFK